MSHPSRRVPLTVPHDLDLILDRLCVLMDKKKTQIITEFLLEMQPALGNLADALEAIQKKEDPMKYINALAADTLEKAGEIGSGMRDVQRCVDTLELPL